MSKIPFFVAERRNEGGAVVVLSFFYNVKNAENEKSMFVFVSVCRDWCGDGPARGQKQGF